MKQLYLTILTLMFGLISTGQNSNAAFEASKGTWQFPIANPQTIDTMTIDCFGMPRNSPYLVLKADCSREVKALQPGIVRLVKNVDGTYMAMVKTGDYFLTYIGLSEPRVKKGDSIQQGSNIGMLVQGDELTLMLMDKE